MMIVGGRMIRNLSTVAAAALLVSLFSACATMTPQETARLTEIAEKPLYCSGADDCEVKWGRAILWVTNNSHWKLRNQTDSIITTEGPFDTVHAAYSINKVPLGSGKYQIMMQAGCGNMFGCVPDVLELKASFVQFVDAQAQ